MSRADVIFKEMCKDILENGTDTKGAEVRAVWADTNEPAYTIKKFGVVNRYDLREEFPAITLRKTGIKSAMDEILWIFQRKSNNIKDLKPHIWDSWADKNGSIGKAYGYQIGKRFVHHKAERSKRDESLLKEYPSLTIIEGDDGLDWYYMDQMDAVLYDLKFNPFSRRIMTSLWNFEDLHEMNLQPCCWSCNFSVTDEGKDKLVLNLSLKQRSNDVLAANNWNVCQYALLLMMVAQVCNMEAGVLLHIIDDAHIYDRHVDSIKELLTREEFKAPIVKLNKEVKNFYDFTTDDLEIIDYKHNEQIKNIPIAV